MQNNVWVKESIRRIQADFNRSADTHLIRLPLKHFPQIDFYLKDESTHPTGSLKHRLARSLFLYGICNGWITENTPIIEASSGSTAISEAYFAQLIGLKFIAVVPRSTAQAKLKAIEFYGGECHLIDGTNMHEKAEKLAKSLGGHFMDQFTYAERATDWRGNNNIAESLFDQMSQERFPIPRWIVCGAGTGGTSATFGRYLRYYYGLSENTELCVVDPENSAFYPFFSSGDRQTASVGSRIEGIGRPQVEASFIHTVVDRMIQVPDSISIATIWWLESKLGRKCGPSTGTNVYGALQLIQEMAANNESGSVVTLICDSGERYLDTYYSKQWLTDQGLSIKDGVEQLKQFDARGVF